MLLSAPWTADDDGSVTASSTAVSCGRCLADAALAYAFRPASSAFRSDVSLSQLAKNTTSRDWPGPSDTVVPPAAPEPLAAAAGSVTCAVGPCAGMAARDCWLASFGCPGRRL